MPCSTGQNGRPPRPADPAPCLSSRDGSSTSGPLMPGRALPLRTRSRSPADRKNRDAPASGFCADPLQEVRGDDRTYLGS